MLLNVARGPASIQIVARLRASFVMVHNARFVLLEVANCVKGCGISFNCMPGLVRSRTAMFHAAGVLPNTSTNLSATVVSHFMDSYVALKFQGPEGASQEVTTAIRFTSQGCSNGDDEATCCRSCGEQCLGKPSVQLVSGEGGMYHLAAALHLKFWPICEEKRVRCL